MSFPRLFFLVSVLLFSTGPLSRAQYGPNLGKLESALRDEVEFFCDSVQQGRGFGGSGKFHSTAYLRNRFRGCGLQPLGSSYIHEFEHNGKFGRNIVGFRQGPQRDSYIIVGSSIDGLGRLSGKIYPGADSNASGLAALVSLADSLSATGPSVIFVAFDGRNAGFSGSQAFWKELSRGALRTPDGRVVRPDMIRLMVNIDIIGSTLSPVHSRWRRYVIVLGDKRHYPGLMLQNNIHSLGLRIEDNYYGSRDFTDLFYRRIGDQKVFLNHGIPVMLWTSGITDNTNKVTDLPATLNYPVFACRVELLRRFLEAFKR